MAKTRTFIAVAIDDQLRAGARLAIERLRSVAPSFRWAAEEGLHYTLHFLGDLSDTEVVQVCQRTAVAALEVQAFSLCARGVGGFPSNNRPRTLWIGAHEGEENLARLHRVIGDAVEDLGFRGETRKYVPHLTIGKLGRQGHGASSELVDQLAQLADFDAGSMRVEEVTVFASELRPDGPEYHVLATAPLGG